MIFGNGLKKVDFARQNLDGRAKCLAQKNEKNTAPNIHFYTARHPAQSIQVC